MKPATDADVAKFKIEYEKKQHKKQFVAAKQTEKKKKKLALLQKQKLNKDMSAYNRLTDNGQLSNTFNKFKIPRKLPSRGESGSSGRIMDVKSTSQSGGSSGLAKCGSSRNTTIRPRNAFDAPVNEYFKTGKLHSPGPEKRYGQMIKEWFQRNDECNNIIHQSSSDLTSTTGNEASTVESVSEIIPVITDANLEVIPMDIDVDEVVGGIQEFRVLSPHNSEKEVCGPLAQLSNEIRINTNKPETENDSGAVKIILLVLDTNVLASDLNMIDILMKTWTGENGSTKLILVVPWVVLQELDKLKDDRQDKKPKLKSLAANAVRYLHGLLTSGNTQIKGQTIHEASADVGWEITCNDDRILQCCFQCKKQGEGEVILFTNDRNLCNKALVNQLQAYTKESITKELEKIAPLPVKQKKLQNITWDGKVETSNEFCDEILSQVKSILYNILENIVKTEMFRQFRDKWTSMIIIEPPWRLEDILACLKKHWIAVFSFVDRKSSNMALTQLDTLRAKFKLDQGTFSKDDLKALLIASVHLLTYFGNNESKYKEDVRICIHQMRNFLDEVKNIRLATFQKKTGQPSQEQHALAQEATVQPEADVIYPWDDVCMTTVDEGKVVNKDSDQSNAQHLRNTLHGIWNFINNTCGLILDTLSFPHTICYQRPKPLLSTNEALSTIPTFFSTVTGLALLVEKVLRLEETPHPGDEAIVKLAAYLDNFFFILGMESDTKVDEIITSVLHKYITTHETRDRLILGFRQLEEICTLLNQCIINVESRSLGRANVVKKDKS